MFFKSFLMIATGFVGGACFGVWRKTFDIFNCLQLSASAKILYLMANHLRQWRTENLLKDWKRE